MTSIATGPEWVLGILLVLSSLGIILLRKPVHACLSFLLTLLALSALYLQLSAQFVAVMQVLVYAGAILVIFMFVIVLFQDAYLKIAKNQPQSFKPFLIFAAGALLITLFVLAQRIIDLDTVKGGLPEGFGTVESIGNLLYIDFFFPFEAVILLFLVAVIGALYIGKKVKQDQIQ